MAITYVTGTFAASDNLQSKTTSAIDTTGADLLVVTINIVYGGTLTDSKGNTWTALTDYGTGFVARIYYCANPTVGTGHTFSISGAFPTYPTIGVAAFAGCDTTSPFDQQNGAGNSSTNSLATGSITPTEDGEVLVTGCGYGTLDLLSINSGFTKIGSITAQTSIGMGIAYKIQTTASAENPTWSMASASNMAAGIASFKAAGGGGGSNQPATKRYGGTPHMGSKPLGNDQVRMYRTMPNRIETWKDLRVPSQEERDIHGKVYQTRIRKIRREAICAS